MKELLKPIKDFSNLIDFILKNTPFLLNKNRYITHYLDFTIESSCGWILDSISKTIKTINSIIILINEYAIVDAISLVRKMQYNIFIFIYLWYIDTSLNPNSPNANTHYKILKGWMSGTLSKSICKKYINPKEIFNFLNKELLQKEPISDLFYILDINEADLVDDANWYSAFCHNTNSIYTMNLFWESIIKTNKKSISFLIDKILLLQKFLLLFILRHRKIFFVNQFISGFINKNTRTNLLAPINHYINIYFSKNEILKIKEKTGII